MDEDRIREAAHRKWEEEGRPEGQADRHWLEAERENNEGDLPKTWSSDHSGGVAPPEPDGQTTSDAIPSNSDEPGKFKPGELASENK